MQKLATARTLQTRLTTILKTVESEFGHLSDEQLRWKPAPRSWSIIECLQHLNLAERYYIRNLQHKVDQLGLVQTMPTDQTLASDRVGRTLNWIVNPETKLKFPAPGIIKPRSSVDLHPANVLAQFLEIQYLLRELLDKAVYLDWNADKLTTIFGNWLKIRVGDALQMLVSHSERHLNQAMRVKKEMDTFAATNNNL
ncbi:hypothetical protein GGR92_000045 [Spirosoma lacussanchae]|uniref:DinB family protein n=1 Tax=Spirosoma lacussanchae TaxID=1884249 RepID=UPI001107B22D|nr:DinB family protein [Spirosoma lacussanchae]